MAELSYFELLQMVDSTVGRLESVFQFWLSATFAAIVASHLASDKLTKMYASALVCLYLVFTFSVVVRVAAWRTTLEQYLQRLAELRGEPGGAAVFDLINYSLWATIMLGSLLTVLFIWQSHGASEARATAA